MILVDYKGGAAFAPFAGLPHVAGIIDNLADDPQLTERARASIQGEVVRRQRLLKDAGNAASIGHYRQLRARAPRPAARCRTCSSSSTSSASCSPPSPTSSSCSCTIGRIGRSIGVHLLLSSQRIEGGRLRGLDTYLSYRLGLRTFSESESAGRPRHPRRLPPAARSPATATSRSTRRVYTRFRAGYVSGPVCAAEAARRRATPTLRPLLLPIYNGVRRALATTQGPALPPLTRARHRTHARARPRSTAPVATATVRTRPVWLPPLPDGADARRRAIDRRRPRTRALTMRPSVCVDDPEPGSAQAPWLLDLTRSGGHVAIIGAPQSGRIDAPAARSRRRSRFTHTPREVSIYGMDLTGGGLPRIEAFPHVGGVATRGHRERLRRLLEELAGDARARASASFREHGLDRLARRSCADSTPTGGCPSCRRPTSCCSSTATARCGRTSRSSRTPFVDIMLRASSFGIHLVLDAHPLERAADGAPGPVRHPDRAAAQRARRRPETPPPRIDCKIECKLTASADTVCRRSIGTAFAICIGQRFRAQCLSEAVTLMTGEAHARRRDRPASEG